MHSFFSYNLGNVPMYLSCKFINILILNKYFQFAIIFLLSIFFLSCNLPIEEPKRDYGYLSPSENEVNNCQQPPEGMVCISNDRKRNKSITPFYLDKFEVSNKDYEECVSNFSCPKNKFISLKENKKFSDPEQPSIGVTYSMAHAYCVFRGKRLPTGYEYDTALSTINNKIDCSTGNVFECDSSTKKIGNYPEKTGIHDLLGNAVEWVNEWADECGGNCNDISCGDICRKNNPVCSGKFPCQKYDSEYLKIDWENLNLDGIRNTLNKPRLTKKILRGGSFEIKDTSIVSDLNDTSHKPGFRCASDTIYLTNTPAWMVKKPFSNRSIPINLDTKQSSILNSPFERDTISDKPLCKQQFTSPANCRDPVSYTKPNEARNYLFGSYIRNLGGGYVGVAADANYTFLTYARSEFVWLMDFNINIVNLHRINKVFILESSNPKEFLQKWNPKNKISSLKLLELNFSDNVEWKNIKAFFEINQSGMFEHYMSISYPDKLNPDFGWLRDDSNYEYLRSLHQMGRIFIVEGDLLKDKSLFSIGTLAKKLKIKIRIFYPSNAEEFWKFSKNYKRNILNLPFDEASVVLRTVHEFPWQKNELPNGSSGFWHYVVHGGYNYQKKLSHPDFYLIDHFKEYRVFPGNMKDFSTIDLPSSLPPSIQF